MDRSQHGGRIGPDEVRPVGGEIALDLNCCAHFDHSAESPVIAGDAIMRKAKLGARMGQIRAPTLAPGFSKLPEFREFAARDAPYFGVDLQLVVEGRIAKAKGAFEFHLPGKHRSVENDRRRIDEVSNVLHGVPRRESCLPCAGPAERRDVKSSSRSCESSRNGSVTEGRDFADIARKTWHRNCPKGTGCEQGSNALWSGAGCCEAWRAFWRLALEVVPNDRMASCGLSGS